MNKHFSTIVSDKQGEEIAIENTTIQTNGNPALKDAIISNIIASRSAENQTEIVPVETQDTSSVSSASTSETSTPDATFTVSSMDTGGLSQ